MSSVARFLGGLVLGPFLVIGLVLFGWGAMRLGAAGLEAFSGPAQAISPPSGERLDARRAQGLILEHRDVRLRLTCRGPCDDVQAPAIDRGAKVRLVGD
jgi:hypothetical protein